MKLYIKKIIFFSYWIICLSLSRRPASAGSVYLRVILSSVSGIKNASTAGDASILEFSAIFSEACGVKDFEQLALADDFKKLFCIQVSDVVITRDMISFVLIDLFRVVSGRKFLLIYYATDVFSNRLPSDLNRFSRLYKKASISSIEQQIWKSADYIYANRVDEKEIIEKFNHNVACIPAHSRTPNKIVMRQPVVGQGYNFIFVGSSGNVPNRQSIRYFTEKYWPKMVDKFPGSLLVIVGGGWDKFVISSQNVILTGFLSDEELQEAYSQAHFAVGYLVYGAGVKGKVLEAMEHSTVVLGNDVAFEGISCQALQPFRSFDDLAEQVFFFLNPDHYQAAVDEYAAFLKKNYSATLIEEGILSCIKK